MIDGQRWYVSGDKGKLDQDGFLTIVDRYSRFAKLGGEMISLSATEQAVIDAYLEEHRQGDIELVAVNIPDAKKGETISLLYQGELNVAQLKKQMLARGVNPLMIPKAWHQVDVIPKLGAGKTDFSQATALATALAQG